MLLGAEPTLLADRTIHLIRDGGRGLTALPTPTMGGGSIFRSEYETLLVSRETRTGLPEGVESSVKVSELHALPIGPGPHRDPNNRILISNVCIFSESTGERVLTHATSRLIPRTGLQAGVHTVLPTDIVPVAPVSQLMETQRNMRVIFASFLANRKVKS